MKSKLEINRDNVNYFLGLLIGTVTLISFVLLWYFLCIGR